MSAAATATQPSGQPFDARQIARPDPVLLRYYVLVSLLLGPFFWVALLPLFFKYETLRYRFDDEGVSMSWGILWRREVHLTYRRIQDIHLTRNIVQRWMGLATVSIQTAAGSALPEMSIEGILQAAELRDFLYGKMRKGEPGAPGAAVAAPPAAAPADEALVLLRDIRDGLKTLAGRRGGTS
jgi:putative membrane protein